MDWRETVHFSQTGRMLNLIERGAHIAWAMKSIPVAEGIAARGIADKAVRPQGD